MQAILTSRICSLEGSRFFDQRTNAFQTLEKVVENILENHVVSEENTDELFVSDSISERLPPSQPPLVGWAALAALAIGVILLVVVVSGLTIFLMNEANGEGAGAVSLATAVTEQSMEGGIATESPTTIATVTRPPMQTVTPPPSPTETTTLASTETAIPVIPTMTELPIETATPSPSSTETTALVPNETHKGSSITEVVSGGQKVTISANEIVAHVEGDNLKFEWEVDKGVLSSNNESLVTYTAPYEVGIDTVNLFVTTDEQKITATWTFIVPLVVIITKESNITEIFINQEIVIYANSIGRNLKFEWGVKRGTLSKTDGPSVIYTAPKEPGTDVVDVVVISNGYSISKKFTFTVIP